MEDYKTILIDSDKTNGEPKETIMDEESEKVIDNALWYLYLLPTDWNPLFDNGNIKKVVFQFCVLESEGNALTLGAWPTKNKIDYDGKSPKKYLHTWMASLLKFEKNFFLGDQYINKDEIKKIQDELKPNINFIIFEPKKDANSHIYYLIYVSEKLELIDKRLLAGTLVSKTNPSPPATA